MADARSESSSIGDDGDSTFSAFDRPFPTRQAALRDTENNLAQSSKNESDAERNESDAERNESDA